MADMEIPVSEFRQSISDFVNRVAYSGDRVILERHGKKVAAVVPIGDLERLNGGDRWSRFKRRGEAIQKLNNERLLGLNFDRAIRDLEGLLREVVHVDIAKIPLPVSISRLLNRGKRGRR